MFKSSLMSVFFVTISLLLSLVNGRRRLNQWAKEEENNFDEPQPIKYNNYYHNYNDGGAVIQVSANAVYVIGGLIVFLLFINVSCLFYSNCFMNNKRTHKYSKVDIMAQSD